MMKLYSGPLSMFGAKVQIAALEKGLAFELHMVPFDTNDRYEPRHPEVLRVNPKRQVPVLTDGELGLYDSTQSFGERKGALMTQATPRLLAWRERVGARAPVRAVVRPMMEFLASHGRPVPAHLQPLLA